MCGDIFPRRSEAEGRAGGGKDGRRLIDLLIQNLIANSQIHVTTVISLVKGSEALVVLNVHGPVDMASVIAASEATARPSAGGLIRPERSEQFEEALRALDNYKKKDPSKGALHCFGLRGTQLTRRIKQWLFDSKRLEMHLL